LNIDEELSPCGEYRRGDQHIEEGASQTETATRRRLRKMKSTKSGILSNIVRSPDLGADLALGVADLDM
jgi:hypothetical protein